MAKDRKPLPFPSKDEIVRFIRETEGKVTKREIARAFHIKGQEKIILKKILKELISDGVLAKDNHKSLRPSDRLPPVQVVEFAGIDSSGDPLVKVVSKYKKTSADTKIFLDEKKKGRVAAMGPGDRALARLIPVRDNPPVYRAEVIKRLDKRENTVLGVFHGNENGGRVTPVDKKARDEYIIAPEDIGEAKDGELVLVEAVMKGKKSKHMGLQHGRVGDIIGDVSSAKTVSMIAVAELEIPYIFPDDVTAEAEKATNASPKGRVDIRDIPLITIDPADARDHDDAIWAEADVDPNNKGGWHVIVAIADVAHFVKPGSPLDQEAHKRGNSCYFPDRVIPMLPEALSAGLCSLKPGEDRACMAVHLWFDKNGNKIRHKFFRGFMRSAANISYERVQAAIDGNGTEDDNLLLEPVLKPLFGAFTAIMRARDKREPLELDLPERKIILNDQGHVSEIQVRERMDAHRIVEEMMIAANVAASETLEKHKVLPMYRVHEEPSMEKMESLRDFLGSLDIPFTKGQVTRPSSFNGILKRVKDTAHSAMISVVVLRSQMQAYYSIDNLGHFGLALTHYAHFTSPIRRYADLMVHRGLITAIKAGHNDLKGMEREDMSDIAEHISMTERRAMKAERSSTDRYIAAYLHKHVGEEMEGRITSVTRFGLFLTLEPSGGDGLIPMRSLGGDYYNHIEEEHALVGERTGHRLTLGDVVTVRLEEANKITGGIRLSLLDMPKGAGKHRKGGKGRTFHKKVKKRNNKQGRGNRR